MVIFDILNFPLGVVSKPQGLIVTSGLPITSDEVKYMANGGRMLVRADQFGHMPIDGKSQELM
jgi:hypothetical protein